MPARESAKCVECGTDNENGAVYCKNCGQKLVEPQKMCGSCGATVYPHYSFAMCPSCGGLLNPVAVQQTRNGTEPVMQDNAQPRYAGSEHGTSTTQPAATAQHDMQVFGKLRLFGILGIAEAILGIFVLLFGDLTVLLAAGAGGTHATGNVLFIDIAVLIGELAIGAYSIFVLRSAFRILSRIDRMFHTPASLVTVLIIGFVVIFPALIIIIAAGTAAPAALSTGMLIVVGFMMIVGLVLLVLGVIGLLIGLWRIGTRYNDSLYKIAAIFYIIPFLGVVSSILIYAASTTFLRQGSNRLQGH